MCLFTAGKKPQVLSQLKDVKIISPKSAALKCDISPGDPVAKVTWFKNGKEIKSNRKYDMSYRDQYASLIIKDTDVSDTAVYTCSADNKVGLVETEAKLTVLGQLLW